MDSDDSEHISLGKRLKWIAIIFSIFAIGLYWENSSWDRDEWEASSRSFWDQEVGKYQQEVAERRSLVAEFDRQISEHQLTASTQLMESAGATRTKAKAILAQQLSNLQGHRANALLYLDEAEAELRKVLKSKSSIEPLWDE